MILCFHGILNNSVIYTGISLGRLFRVNSSFEACVHPSIRGFSLDQGNFFRIGRFPDLLVVLTMKCV